MLLLEIIYRLEVAVQVVAAVVPRIAGIVDIFVGPYVGENDFAGVGFEIGKGVEDVADGGSVSWMIISR